VLSRKVRSRTMIDVASKGNSLSFATSSNLSGPLSTPLEGDGVPDAVNWTTLNADGVDWQAESMQFTGINSIITVHASVTSGSKTLCYFKKGTTNLTGYYPVGSPPASNGYTLITSAATQVIVVSPNEWVTFAAFENVGFVATQTCTVTNQTTGGNTLDTFPLTTVVAPP